MNFSLTFITTLIVITNQIIADLSIKASSAGTPISRSTERRTRTSNERPEWIL